MEKKVERNIIECLWKLEESPAKPNVALILKLIVLILWFVVIILSFWTEEKLGMFSLWMTVVLATLTMKVERNKEKKSD